MTDVAMDEDAARAAYKNYCVLRALLEAGAEKHFSYYDGRVLLVKWNDYEMQMLDEAWDVYQKLLTTKSLKYLHRAHQVADVGFGYVEREPHNSVGNFRRIR